MQTLKHVVVNIYYDDGVDGDPLFRILSEFEDMRIKNSFETVTIRVKLYGISHGGNDWGVWGMLDEIFTTPGWFSVLKQVSLAISIARYTRGHDNELEEELRKLSETPFPRLSSSNSISFDFAVISK